MHERPLSPHVFLYKWGYTMSLSILHRVTGMALAFGLIILVAWLMAAAGGQGSYARAYDVFSSLPFKLLFGGGLFIVIYHTCNGLRHLAWDMGWGFERHEARRSAAIVVAVALIATAICLYFAFVTPAGVP